MKDRVIIFRDTFNLPTKSDIDVATEVLYYLDAERVLFVPTSDFDRNNNTEVSYHRVAMLDKTIGDFRRLEIDFTEVDSVKPIKLSETILIISEQYNKELFLIIDQCELANFKDKNILDKCSLLVINNEENLDDIINSNEILKEFKEKIIEAPIVGEKIDKIEIIEKIKLNNFEGLEFVLDEKVINYVKENNLFLK